MQEPPPHVLVVDDDPVIVRLIELNFRLAGFRVSGVTRGDLAVERAAADPPDAVVLDVTMPGLDGYAVGRHLHQDQGLVHVPIVMLTAHAPDEDEARSEAAGVVAHVTKPFDPEALVAVVREALVAGDAP